MVRGLYAAYTGMLNEQKRLDVVSNNVANAATVGYKKEGVTNQSFQEMLTLKIKDATVGNMDEPIGNMSLGVKLGEEYTDYTQGSFRQTGNTFDLALEGKGFFSVAVMDAQGNETVRYTRDGSFKLSNDGYLLDTDGNHVLGEGGYIQVPAEANEIAIDASGNITADGEFLDKMLVVDFADYNYVQKYGNNLYGVVDGAEEVEAKCTVYQGFLEQSNVQAVNEMVNMITITRAYEANQKVISTIDNMLDKAVNSVGRV